MAKVTFGIIALNAQPFLEYNLRALYPFAHQIIVVEGAVRTAADLARPDGHSRDGTFEMLQHFAAEEDPERKLEIVQARDEGYSDGFWPEKDEMSQAYARRATGDWLWQVDSDEFYLEADMRAVMDLLDNEPAITAVSFPYREFFGSFESTITGKWHLFHYPSVHRLFRWGKGYTYTDHRPSTVLDGQDRNLRDLNWIANPRNNTEPIYLFHYSYVLPKQAEQKVGYYAKVLWTEAFRANQDWYERCYLELKDPFFLGEHGRLIFQWLEPYKGPHPEQIQRLRADLEAGMHDVEIRRTEDIKRLLASPAYRIGTGLLRILMPVYWRLRRGSGGAGRA